MRILMIADVPPDPHSGVAGTEWQTVEALRALGHEVDTVWAPDLGPRRIAHGNLHYLLELPRTMRQVVRERLASAAYDVLHVNQPHGWLAARWLRRHGGSSRPVFVHRSHGFELNVEASLLPWVPRFGGDARTGVRKTLSRVLAPLLARSARAIGRYADGHIVYSSLDAEFMTRELGIAPERIAVVPPAAPDGYVRMPAPPMTPERLRRVVYVSQFAFFKAPHVTAAAFRDLASRRAELTFTWVCDRTHHPMVRELLGPAAERTTLLHWMPQDELVRVYDDHGVFIFPSFYEGFGKVVLEAMSRSLCVVASDMGGPHDVIESGVNGILVPIGDAKAVVAAVESLTPEGGAAMSERAAASARLYTWERAARETVAHYERLRDLLASSHGDAATMT